MATETKEQKAEYKADEGRVKAMFAVGAHFGYRKARRHPSVKPYVFGVKDTVEIFDLEKTDELLSRAQELVRSLAANGKSILFVGSKEEAHAPIRNAAERINQPYVAGRWIGGTLTNFSEIKKRIERLETLRVQRERGELSKYTKRERLMIDREITKLEQMYGGVVSLKDAMPAALFVIDPKHEAIAVSEAKASGIPVIALASSDANLSTIEYPIVANDGNINSIRFFVGELVSAFEKGHSAKPAAEATTEKK